MLCGSHHRYGRGKTAVLKQNLQLLCYMCNWIQMSFSCHLGKCDFALISVTFFHFVSLGWSFQIDPIGGTYVLVRKKDVSRTMRKRWMYKPACLPGCTVPSCTQVSCKLSWQFYLLIFHVQYRWMCCCSVAENDYVRRLDRGRGRHKPQGKPIISPNLCIIRCITSRTVDQNLLAM